MTTLLTEEILLRNLRLEWSNANWLWRDRYQAYANARRDPHRRSLARAYWFVRHNQEAALEIYYLSREYTLDAIRY